MVCTHTVTHAAMMPPARYLVGDDGDPGRRLAPHRVQAPRPQPHLRPRLGQARGEGAAHGSRAHHRHRRPLRPRRVQRAVQHAGVGVHAAEHGYPALSSTIYTLSSTIYTLSSHYLHCTAAGASSVPPPARARLSSSASLATN